MNIGEIKSGLKTALQKFISEDDMSLRSVSYNSGCNRHFLNKVLDDRPVKSLDISQVLLLTMFLSRKSTLRESIQSAVIRSEKFCRKPLQYN